ncbi:type II secretion system F family protein [Piscinibacter defluvii]|uniref:type II secretion system F family protein n=1 Tax=Piscinibacter defluvii TaxID=1796922 RepID=UPI000FDEDC6B|nr:type II secretion system F family protein [Piscinibacter defluvii]
MQYTVRWFDAAAAVVRQESADAASAQEAAGRFEAAGRVVLSVERAAQAARAPRLRRSELDVAWWCRELRTLLAAGMTVVEALETLQAQPLGRARAEVHALLVEQLHQGRALSAAMQHAAVFPAVLVAGVRAGERTSGLVAALDDYLRYHELLERLRRQLLGAAIYPAVVVALGAVITLFLLLFVMPRFAGMYGELHGPVSAATRTMVALSRTLAAHGGTVALALAGAAAALAAAWRAGLVARWAIRAAEAVPPLRRQFDEFRLAKLYQSLALMFRGGYALDDALGHCAALGLGGGLADRVERAQRALATGRPVSAAFGEADLTDSVTQRLLAVGERSGSFDRVLQTIAERHAGNFGTFIERATRIVEPALLLAVSLLVGGIVVAMYMPVFDIASSIR